jgi:hypothetical protein
LRICTGSQNSQHRRMGGDGISEYRGVCRGRGERWRSYIYFKDDGVRRCLSLGTHATAVEAARAYNEAALLHHGEFAVLNDLPDV